MTREGAAAAPSRSGIPLGIQLGREDWGAVCQIRHRVRCRSSVFSYKTAHSTKNLRFCAKFPRLGERRHRKRVTSRHRVFARDDRSCLKRRAERRILSFAGMESAGDPSAGETRKQREVRVRDELYDAWIAGDAVYAEAQRQHDAARAIGDEQRALAVRLELEDLEKSARRFSTLVAREQVWGWRAPFVALFSWVSRRP